MKKAFFLLFYLVIILPGIGISQIDLENGLIAYYPLNGNANDESGNGNHGTLIGAAYSTNEQNQPASALLFDGDSDYLEIPSPARLGNFSNWSIALDLIVYDGNGAMQIYGEFNTGNSSKNGMFYDNANQGVKFDQVPGTGGGNEIATKPHDLWASLVISKSGGTILFYVNGALFTSEPYESYTGPSPSLSVMGSRMNNGTVLLPQSYSFLGKMDNIRIYNRALNASEISFLSNECGPITSLAYLPLNGSGDDISGNENHGTQSGTISATDRNGNPYGALLFDGIDDHININNPFGSSITDESPFSIALWVKTSSTKNEANLATYFTKCSGGSEDDYFAISIKNGNTLSISNGNGAPFDYSTPGISDDNFHQIALSFDGTEYELFIDGVLATSFTLPPAPDAIPDSYRVVLGYVHSNSCGDNSFFDGVMDDVVIFDRPIDLAEVQLHFSQSTDIVTINKTTCDTADVGISSTSYFNETCEIVTDVCITSLQTGISSNGLIAYYPFDGDIKDYSGNNYDATNNGAVPTTDRLGNPASAFSFDGSSAFLTVPNSDSAFNNQRWTINAWVKWEDGAATANGGGIFSVTSDDLNKDHYAMTVHETKFRSWLNFPDSPDPEFDFLTNSFQDGNFHHVSATYDGSKRKLYLDGALVREEAFTEVINFDNSVQCFIGVDFPGGDDYFKGTIDELSIFNRALSSTEISQIYQSNLNQGLITHYPFDGNATDITGNSTAIVNSGATLTNDRFGVTNNAYHFDGSSNAYISTSFDWSSWVNTGDPFQISVWIKSSSSGTNHQIIAGDPGGGPDNVVNLQGTGKLKVAIFGGAVAESDLTYNDDQWHHVSIGTDGVSTNFYVDGVPQSQLPTIGSFNRDVLWMGGRSCCPLDNFNGDIDDVKIYNRQLSHSEVLQLYSQSSSPCEDCTSFTDLTTPQEAVDAATCLCESGYINPQFYDAMNINGVNPTASIFRADLAKLVYYSLYYDNVASPADDFPVPFLDLQSAKDPYFRYAKALSYLDYGDGITPFDNDLGNFNPYNTIQRRYALKVLLEAYNIQPDESGPSPFPAEINPGDDAYGYVKKAFTEGWITQGNVTDDMIREDMFVILYRLLSSCGGSCIASCMNPNPVDSNYIKPGNITPKNMGRNFGMAEGYFQNYTTTSFNIPGIKLPLEFSHLYNSYLTQIPDSLRSIQPLGEGWTHSYNAYIVKQAGWDTLGITVPDHWMVMWPNGAIHSYDCSADTTLNYGVYDDFQVIDSDTIQIKKQSQIVFTFSKFTYPSGKEYFMLTRIADRNNNQINISYTNAITPRIDIVTGTAGRVLQFNYANGVTQHISSIQDIAGTRSILFNVDGDNNLESYTDPNGHTTTYSYTDPIDPTTNAGDHLLYSITRPEGNNMTNKYKNGILTSSQIGQSVPSTGSVNRQYPAGITSEWIDGNNTKIKSVYALHGYQMSREIDETKMRFKRIEDDPALIKMIDYESLQTHYAYDDEGRIDTISMPLDIEHTFTYTALNDIKTYKDPLGNTTTYNYTNGNIDNISDNMGFVTDFTVNSLGQVLQIENPENIIQSFTYDVQGNLTQIHAPLNITTKMAYDAIGRLDSIINPQQQVTKYEYDALGLVKKMIRRSSIDGDIMTMYDYDMNNNLKTITNALGGQTTFMYEDRDLLETMTFGDDTKLYAYREDGLLDTYEKPDGHIFVYEYDTLGRLETDGYADYTYDSLDNIIEVMKDGLPIEMTYDAINRLDTVTYDGFTVIYEYDKNSNLTRLKYPDGFEVTYGYDANNRLDSLTFDSKTIDYQYLRDGRIDQVNLPTGGRREYDYDAAGRMTYMADLKSPGDTISRYFFSLDSLGNHVREDRLEPEGEPTLEELNILYGYNAENEIDFANDDTFSFDENGNQINNNGTVGVFDDKDMMTSYKGRTYTYDGLGLRRTIDDGNGVKKYIWDVRGMGYVLAETNTSGVIEYYYVYGQGLEARIRKSDMAVTYYHSDFRGSTIAMTDDTETITHSYSYLPFGELVGSTETDPNPFKYVGRYGVMDEGDNLYYMRARYMDAMTGRFLSEDPVWHENLYVYAESDPVNYIDPHGEFGLFMGAATGIIAGVAQAATDYITEGKVDWSNALRAGGVGFVAGATGSIWITAAASLSSTAFDNQYFSENEINDVETYLGNLVGDVSSIAFLPTTQVNGISQITMTYLKAEVAHDISLDLVGWATNKIAVKGDATIMNQLRAANQEKSKNEVNHNNTSYLIKSSPFNKNRIMQNLGFRNIMKKYGK